METYPDSGCGQRPDGTDKGPGFASRILPDGSVMTEYSPGPVGALCPAVYLGICRRVYQYGCDPLQWEVFDRAYQSSLLRAMQGQPPFWTPGTVRTGAGYMPR